MDRALLKSSLERWGATYEELRSSLIPRRSLPDLPTPELALAISGVRRSGKTTLALQLSKTFKVEDVLYYNFEDPLFIGAEDPGGLEILFSLYKQQCGHSPKLVIFDEIQNIPGWERWMRAAVDQRRSRFIVTGSNAKLLSADLATSLTGRCLEHTVWPLSLEEVKDFLDMPGESSDVDLEFCLNELLTWGGLPASVLSEGAIARERLLRQYLSDLVNRDIVSRKAIRNKRSLDILVTYYHTNLSSLHSYSAIKKAFGIPIDTVSEYTAALREAFLVFEVERYHPNLKVQSRDPRKVYVVDSGLRRIAARSPEADTGKLLENLIYLDLCRREKEIYYFQSNGEVDFVLTERYSPVYAVQVCAYGMEIEETRNREISALVSCMSELDIDTGYVVTMDRNETIKMNGTKVQCVSVVEWIQRDL